MNTLTDSIGTRITQAMDLHPRAPSIKYGRLTWLQRELATRGVEVTVETIRKWVNDEVVPRSKKMSALAHALGVDEAWLTLGRAGGPASKMALNDARGTAGAILAVAGALELEDLRVAFLENDDADLSVVVGGRMVRVAVVLGKPAKDDTLEFTLPGKMPEHAVVGVMYAGFGSTVLLRLRAEDFAGNRGRLVASLQTKNLSRRRIKSIEQLNQA